MNAYSLITLITDMLRQYAIRFKTQLFGSLQLTPSVKKNTLYFSSYSNLYVGLPRKLSYFWVIFQHTFFVNVRTLCHIFVCNNELSSNFRSHICKHFCSCLL